MEDTTGGAAFPLGANEYGGHGSEPCMTLRDYFAAKAMMGMCASDSYQTLGAVAHDAYALADAMMKERDK